MALRCLDPPRLGDGARLDVKIRMFHTIDATILPGCWNGVDVSIPEVSIGPIDVPFEFKKHHIILSLNFVTTVKKSTY